MPYASGTVAANPNPNAQIVAVLEPTLLAAGFVFVEQVVQGLYTARVYRSPAASNAAGQDWYFYLTSRSDSTTLFYVALSEGWDATTKRMVNAIPARTSQSQTPQANGTTTEQNTGYTVDLVASTTSGALAVTYTLPANAAYLYFLSATADRVVFATRNGASDTGAHFGLTDCVIAPGTAGLYSNPAYELVIYRLISNTSPGSGSATNLQGVTREPVTTVSTVYAYSLSTGGAAGVALSDTTYSSPARHFIAPFAYASGRSPGSARGLMRGVFHNSVIATAINGDTITIGPKVYVRIGQGTGVAGNFFVDNSV